METKVVYQTYFDKIQFVCNFEQMEGYISFLRIKNGKESAGMKW